ncbi:MAG: Gfo/Idh/MocA family oxidoreductase [Lentisphaerae bacterium]|nr:Gfo/Idh/MocA family oxidoreductase [Lentisphaerota bacterium]
MKDIIKVALYGNGGGHQVWKAYTMPQVEVVGVSGIEENALPESVRGKAPHYGTLEEMVKASGVDIVSLCSPVRKGQAELAVWCMEQGIHVYAEKPSAFTEDELDKIIATSKRTGMIYHEQAGTYSAAPYCGMRRLISEGAIGKVISVHSQKSYPWHDARPKCEDIDGGLIRQVGIYNMRFVEYVTGVKISDISARETMLGNDHENSDCRRAVVFSMTLENGGVATGTANYCGPRPPDWNHWGFEYVRVFGETGFIEGGEGLGNVRLFQTGKGVTEIDVSKDQYDFFEAFVEEVRSGKRVIDLAIEDELSPCRKVIMARKNSILVGK